MKISVIVPVYRVEKYLSRCVESILSQSFTDFELILIDDGSPDNCPDLCDKYSERDGRVKVIHQNNSGVSSARNNGLLNAKGEWVLFIDSDDELNKNALSCCINSIEDSTQLIMYGFSIIKRNNVVKEFLPKYFNKEFYVDNFHPGTRFVKREFLIKNKIYFPDGITLAEDWFYNYNIYVNDPVVKFIDKSLYYYYQIDESVMHNLKIKNIEDEMKTIDLAISSEKVHDELINSRKVICKRHILRNLGDINMFRNTYTEVNKLMFSKSSVKMKFVLIMLKLHLDFFVRIIN